MEKQNRWLQAGIGVIVLLFAGMVYAWSVLSSPIAQEFSEWTKAELSLTFTIVMIFFCVGCIAGGFLASKLSARIYLLVSAVLFLAGFLWASGISSTLGLYLSFGVICGSASGFAYSAVMGTVGKWFPDKQGMISGILLMGFGISSFLIGKLYQRFTPAEIGGWRTAFRVLGILTAAVLVICSFFIRKPSADYSVAGNGKKKKSYKSPVAEEAATSVMVRRPAFWLYYLWAVLLSAGGLIIVSQATGIASEVGENIPAGTIATVVGLISIFNGIGRVLMGTMYDRRGRSAVMQTVNVLFILTAFILMAALTTKNFTLIVVGFIVCGLGYGGVTPTNSAFVSSYYGMKHYPLNFSVINTNLIFASFGSTIAGAMYDATGSFMSSYLLMAGLAVVGIAVSIGISVCDSGAFSDVSHRHHRNNGKKMIRRFRKGYASNASQSGFFPD